MDRHNIKKIVFDLERWHNAGQIGSHSPWFITFNNPICNWLHEQKYQIGFCLLSGWSPGWGNWPGKWKPHSPEQNIQFFWYFNRFFFYIYTSHSNNFFFVINFYNVYILKTNLVPTSCRNPTQFLYEIFRETASIHNKHLNHAEKNRKKWKLSIKLLHNHLLLPLII